MGTDAMTQGALWLAVVGLALLLGGLVVVVRPPAAVRAAWLARARAGRALAGARGRHAAHVRQAERAVRRAERRHSAAVGELDRRVVALEDPRGRRLDGFGPVTLHELRLLTPAGEVPLDGVEATVDTAGNLSVTKRATLTRLALGGLVLGPLGAVLALGFQKRRTVDDRELYLMLEAGPASCVVTLEPDAGAQVRAFAVQVNAAAAAVTGTRARIAAELADTRARLAATKEDVSDLEAARAALAAARVEPGHLGAIAAAEARLAAARRAWVETRGGPASS
jgi:hypothetical protein